MTRKISARLLRARKTIVWVAMAIAALLVTACESQSAATQSAAAQGPASSAPASRASAAAAGTVDHTSSQYGTPPDSTLPKACLVSPSYVGALLRLTDAVAKQSPASSEVCEYAGKRDMDSSSQDFRGPHAVTMLVDSDFSLSGRPVSIPHATPFDRAEVQLAQGGVEAAAHPTGTSQSVWFAVWDSHLSDQALLKLGRSGLQNIMYWWVKTHSPASAPSSPAGAAPSPSGTSAVTAPNTPSCQLLAKIRAAGMMSGPIGEWDSSTDPETGSSFCNVYIKHDGRLMDEGLQILSGTDAQTALEDHPSGTVSGAGTGARLYVNGSDSAGHVIQLKLAPDQNAEAQRALQYALQSQSAS